MNQHAPDPPLTEHVQVPCLFLNGISIETTRFVARFVGWVSLPNLGDGMDERRIAVRYVLPLDAARKMRDELDNVL